MKTISSVVQDVIERSPMLGEMMSEGLANNAEIARRIQPEVETLLLEKVSESSIAMALHRLGKEKKPSPYGLKLLKKLNDITVRSNLVAYSSANSAHLFEAFEKISKRAARKRDTFLNFSRGLRESLLIVSEDFEAEVGTALKGERGVEMLRNLSAITMRLPEESLVVPGIYYPILKAIAFEGISLVEVMSVRTEFSIIFEDKDVDRAFSVIKRITS